MGRRVVVDGPAHVPMADVVDEILRAATSGVRDLVSAGVTCALPVATETFRSDTLGDVTNGLVALSGTAAPPGSWSLIVAAGPDVLRSRVLGPGMSVVVGRRLHDEAGCDGRRWTIGDETLSLHHAELSVSDGSLQVRDLGSRNGTATLADAADAAGAAGDDAGGVVRFRIGASVIEGRRIEGQLGGGSRAREFDVISGTWRSSRGGLRPRGEAPIEVPLARSGGRARMRVRPGALVGPLLGGLAMALLLDPKFALFALLSPLLMLVNVVDDRRAAARERRTGERDFASAFEAFARRVRAAERAWVDRATADFPDAGAMLRAATGREGRVWQRSASGPNGWQVRVGTGPVRFRPALHLAGPVPDAVADLLDRLVVPDAPVTVDLGPRAVVVVVGDRSADVVRALTAQLTVAFGPSQLSLALALDPSGPWTSHWRSWLPHDDSSGGGHVLLVQFDARGGVAQAARRHFAEVCPEGAVVLAVRHAEDVPAEATTVVSLGDGPFATVVRFGAGDDSAEVVADGVSADGLEVMSAALACWSEGTATDETLPAVCSLDDLFASVGPSCDVEPDVVLNRGGLSEASSVAERWRLASRTQAALRVPLGSVGSSYRILDLVADGPHALVAGTTGSGKSELLRTLIAGLATQHSPDLVTFVLVDYKGGSAFAECASLPHTVGFVTDLDEGLASRALTCLEAELRRREHVLREAGARDLVSYAAQRGPEPLPRLLVVIDELAALVRDLPTFVPSLVSLAQRGRTLGLHLILATQRPAGTINDAIRANTNIRIALRVQDASDSVDVLGVGDAAMIDRRTPGRALVRLGPGEVQAIQVAAVGLAGVRSVTVIADDAGVEIARFSCDGAGALPGGSTLDRRVVEIRDAFAELGLVSPRRPWPDPLPRSLSRPTSMCSSVAMADEPVTQTQEELTVDIDIGNVAVIGSIGRGVTNALRTIICSLIVATPPGTQFYVLDLLGRDHELLASIAAVGAVVGAHEEERRERLIARLNDEVTRRRATPTNNGGLPMIVVAIDGWSSLRAAGADITMLALGDVLARLMVEGASVGIRFVLGTDRATSLSSAIAPGITTRFVLSPGDQAEAASAGVKFSPSAAGIPGRALLANRPGVEVQFWHTVDPDVRAIAAATSRYPAAPGIAVLPERIALAEIAALLDPAGPDAAVAGTGAWVVPIGVGGPTLGAVHVELRAGEPFLVAGSPRSGRTTAIETISSALAARRPDCVILTYRRGGHAGLFVDDALAACDGGQSVLVTIDDVDRLDDVGGHLAGLLRSENDRLRVVLAGRADVLRSAYGHWSSVARRSRHGLVLQPNPEVDGELWQTPLPRRLHVRGGPGRGALIGDGGFVVVQLAHVVPTGRRDG